MNLMFPNRSRMTSSFLWRESRKMERQEAHAPVWQGGYPAGAFIAALKVDV
jgi:hypothetical protein